MNPDKLRRTIKYEEQMARSAARNGDLEEFLYKMNKRNQAETKLKRLSEAK